VRTDAILVIGLYELLGTTSLIELIWQQQGQHNIIGDAQNALGQDDGYVGTVQLG
jgi:hypothetical protein